MSRSSSGSWEAHAHADERSVVTGWAALRLHQLRLRRRPGLATAGPGAARASSRPTGSDAHRAARASCSPRLRVPEDEAVVRHGVRCAGGGARPVRRDATAARPRRDGRRGRQRLRRRPHVGAADAPLRRRTTLVPRRPHRRRRPRDVRRGLPLTPGGSVSADLGVRRRLQVEAACNRPVLDECGSTGRHTPTCSTSTRGVVGEYAEPRTTATSTGTSPTSPGARRARRGAGSTSSVVARDLRDPAEGGGLVDAGGRATGPPADEIAGRSGLPLTLSSAMKSAPPGPGSGATWCHSTERAAHHGQQGGARLLLALRAVAPPAARAGTCRPRPPRGLGRCPGSP